MSGAAGWRWRTPGTTGHPSLSDGRDGLLIGRPSSERQRREAAALIRNIWGVRVVNTRTSIAGTLVAELPMHPLTEVQQPGGDVAGC
ncbi:MAG: hypothetical protein WDN31_04760 [Hyphomicrobium sp.]